MALETRRNGSPVTRGRKFSDAKLIKRKVETVPSELGGLGKELSRRCFRCLLVSSSYFYLNIRGKRYDQGRIVRQKPGPKDTY